MTHESILIINCDVIKDLGYATEHKHTYARITFITVKTSSPTKDLHSYVLVPGMQRKRKIFW